MTNPRPITIAKGCVGNSCATPFTMNRRTLLQGTAMATAGLALMGLPKAALAQDGAMIENLNLGAIGGGSNPQINFNPFSPNQLGGGIYLYESLYIVNDYDCTEIPWLAESYEWRDDKMLAFTIRQGVQWSDGTPFGPNDVAFTFNMFNQYPGTDLNGAWTYLDNVAVDGNDVVFTYKEVASPEFFRFSEI